MVRIERNIKKADAFTWKAQADACAKWGVLFCVTINGPNSICSEELNDEDYVFTATSVRNGVTDPTGVTFNWSPVPTGWTVSYSGTGNKIMTVTNIATPTSKTVHVTATYNNRSVEDDHYVNIFDCEPRLSEYQDSFYHGRLHFQVSPNPSEGIVQYSLFNNQGIVNLKIFSIHGSELLTQVLQDNKGVLFLDWLPQGIYFINVQDQHEVLTKQIVISK